MTSVILPAQITHIGTEAFRYNDINTVTSLSIEPANLGDDVFIWDNDNDNSVIDLIIPSGTAAAYATAGWTGFKSVTEDEDLSVEDFQVEQNIDLHLVYDNLHITSKNNTQIKSVYIFTILGTCLTTTKSNTISVSHLSPGIYLVRIDTNRGVVSKKIEVQ